MKTLFVLGVSLCAIAANAQNFSIDWSKIAGGGGTSTGGVFSLSGTIGQHDAGTMSGGNFTLDGGFWAVASVVQMPGSPKLTLTQSGNNYILSWPSSSSGFHLELNTAVANNAGWSTVPQTQVTNGATISVTIPVSAGNSFFRLKYP